MPRVSNMHIKRGAVISEVAERFELSKMKIQKKNTFSKKEIR